MYIRRFNPADADAVVRVSELATRITSGAVYDAAFVEEMVAQQDRAYFLTRGEQMHFYVACEDDGTVIGCAAFGPYHKNPAEGCFYSVFVLPEKQKRGVGRALIETIERDPLFLRRYDTTAEYTKTHRLLSDRDDSVLLLPHASTIHDYAGLPSEILLFRMKNK